VNDPRNILVFGATSAIAHETLKTFAAGSRMFLVARDAQRLGAIADDLVARGGAVVGRASYDFAEHDRHQQVMAEAAATMESIDLVLVAHGTLPDQAQCEQEVSAALAAIADNFASAAAICTEAANRLADQGHGTLAVISSVAGDRGRKSNYVYGSAKAGLDTFLQGLRARFTGTRVAILTIKPGMIDTRMTADLPKGPLWVTPERIAPAIRRAILRRRAVVYVPGWWRLVMWVIRLLPVAILGRLSI